MSGGAHFVWFILTLLTGFIALPFWIIAALMCGSSQKKRDRKLMERQTAALEELARANKVNQWKGWMDK